jgi:hypothetical protein
MSEISDKLEREGFFALGDVDVVDFDEASNAWALLEWTAERVAATNLFRLVGLGDDEQAYTQYPNAIIMPGESDIVEATNRSDNVLYSAIIIIRTVGKKSVAVRRIMGIRDRVMRLMQRKPTVEQLNLPERGSQLINVKVQTSPVTFERRADNEWDTMMNVQYTVREPRHVEDRFDG